MRVLILGVSGMLGSTMFKTLAGSRALDVWGTVRSPAAKQYFLAETHSNILAHVDALDHDGLASMLAAVRPDVVINCVGLIKQLSQAKDPLTTLPVNAMLPHRLSALCKLSGARLIHISTDCVFSGRKGNYSEGDLSDAEDLYGKSKFIGELHDHSHVVTLRTSIIGHELNSQYALVDWFLGQRNEVKGYTKAMYSGLPTIELARVIQNHVLCNTALSGLYHVASSPISKFDLLNIVANIYEKDIVVTPDSSVVIDRTLNGDKFNKATGYSAPDWNDLVIGMHKSR